MRDRIILFNTKAEKCGSKELYKNLDTSINADPEHVAKIMEGVEAWNDWRNRNPAIIPNLRGIDFCNSDLIRSSPLWRSEPENDVKPKQDFCELSGANFSKCLLRGASFERANLHGGNFKGAELIFTSFKDADPWDCDLTAADCGGANLQGADFGGVKYSRPKMRRNFLSIKGAEGIIGDAVFKRDVMDQDFLDTLDFRILRQVRGQGFFVNLRAGLLSVSPLLGFLVGILVAVALSPAIEGIGYAAAGMFGMVSALLFACLRTPYGQRLTFEAWGLFDFGRSWRRVGIFASLIIIGFGFVFAQLSPMHLSFVEQATDINPSLTMDEHPLHPYLFSAAGFASGGLLGIAAVRSDLGLILVLANGFLGLACFGLFISTLTATFARQH